MSDSAIPEPDRDEILHAMRAILADEAGEASPPRGVRGLFFRGRRLGDLETGIRLIWKRLWRLEERSRQWPTHAGIEEIAREVGRRLDTVAVPRLARYLRRLQAGGEDGLYPTALVLVSEALGGDDRKALMEAVPGLLDDLVGFTATRSSLGRGACLAVLRDLEALDDTALEISRGAASRLRDYLCDLPAEKQHGLLERLAASGADPDLMGEVKARLADFDELRRCRAADLGALHDAAGPDALALALKGAAEPTRQAFLSALGDAQSQAIEHAMDALGAVPLRDVEAAQARIILKAVALSRAGDISLPEAIARAGGTKGS